MAERAIYSRLNDRIIRANLDSARDEIGAACARSGRPPGDVEILIATKYIAPEAMQTLANAGVKLVGENRAQDLLKKHSLYGSLFTWDFIGHLQGNKVRQVLPLVRLVHSIDSFSLVEEIGKRAETPTEVLLQVNIGKEASKYGIIPSEVDRFLEDATRFSMIKFTGLMTMPPLVTDPEAVRPIFAALRALASDLTKKWQGTYDFSRLSMGTSSDFVVAVEEGATIVRLGSSIFEAKH